MSCWPRHLARDNIRRGVSKLARSLVRKGFDWDILVDGVITEESVSLLEESIIKFFKAHTKMELLEGAVKYRLQLYPVSDTSDILNNIQLKAREYWTDIEHPELNTVITYPGAFVQASETPVRVLRRAPLIGEHNQEIYERELGLSAEQIQTLMQARII